MSKQDQSRPIPTDTPNESNAAENAVEQADAPIAPETEESSGTESTPGGA